MACGLAALLAAGAASADPKDLDLWNGATAGMTIDQAVAQFPHPTPSTGQTLEDGSQSGLSNAAQLGGTPADAIFFFRGNGLTAVVVESHAVRSGQSAENLAEVRRIIDAATSQYGRPKRCIERLQLAALTCTWTVDALAITVAYHDVGGGSPVLSARYSRTR
jgi:hypothetical protein